MDPSTDGRDVEPRLAFDPPSADQLRLDARSQVLVDFAVWGARHDVGSAKSSQPPAWPIARSGGSFAHQPIADFPIHEASSMFLVRRHRNRRGDDRLRAPDAVARL